MRRDHLVPATTVDKNGHVRTVYRKPVQASLSAVPPLGSVAQTAPLSGSRTKTNARLDAEIDQFMTMQASNRQGKYDIARLADPDFATNRCASASHEFAQLLRRERPKIEAGYIPGVRQLDVEWEDINIGHRVNVVDGYVVDWTARQFDPTADFPLIEPIQDYLERCTKACDLHESDVSLLPADSAVGKLESFTGYLDTRPAVSTD